MNATSPLVQRRRPRVTADEHPDDAVAMGQRGDEVAGVVEGLRIPLVGDVAIRVDVRPGHDVARPDHVADGPLVAAERRHVASGRVGQSRPGRDLEAILAHEPEGRGVGPERALRLVDDHPDELRAIVRGSQPADDPQDRVERLGELRFDRLRGRIGGRRRARIA